jgi:phosphatidylglycerol lysyltransferase
MVDIVGASGTLWVLLPASGVDFPTFVVIYTAALALGVLSHTPGGIGVFDAVVLYAVGTQGSPSAVAAALVTYRAIYFLLPFAVAAVLLTATELRRLLQRRRSAAGGDGHRQFRVRSGDRGL